MLFNSNLILIYPKIAFTYKSHMELIILCNLKLYDILHTLNNVYFLLCPKERPWLIETIQYNSRFAAWH
jgi:hypothetical protein